MAPPGGDEHRRNNALPHRSPDENEDDISLNDDDDDERQARTSLEVRDYDHATLTAEEEAERLLTAERYGNARGGGLGILFNGQEDVEKNRAGQRQRRRARRSRNRKSRKDGAIDEKDESELMFKMEEGGRSSSAESTASNSSMDSSEVDLHRLGQVQATTRKKKKSSTLSRCCKFTFIHVVIVLGFMSLLFGAYRATQALRQGNKTDRPPPAATAAKSLSNGTHEFAPTTILVSLDGFRADFLYRNLTPTLSGFVQQGVSPRYMLPSFPSLTFPNHFTLVTGLYPEAHGIVGNTFWDPSTQKEFYYTDPDRSMTPEWWNAEPVWETAELQGVRTAIHMWPGSEAHIGRLEPAYIDNFNADELLDRKVGRILNWLDLPGPNDPKASDETPRPQLIAAYVPDVDADGHFSGPNSTHIRTTISKVDAMMGSLFKGLDERNLTDIVNVVVVSDHGMATTSIHRMIQLEDLINPDLIEHTDGWPLYGLRPYDHSETHLKELYQSIYAKSQLPQFKGTFEVYLRDENMPERYHFTQNDRIAPLWLVPTAGWAIVTKEEFNIPIAIEQGQVYHPRGLHGYDFEHPLMRSIFIARGPAFPHPKGSQVDPFQNLEVYNIVCDSLGIPPRPNNGTLRLPLKPTGVHDANTPLDIPDDPGNNDAVDDFVANLLPPDLPPNLSDFPSQPATVTDTVDEPTATRPVVHDGANPSGDDGDDTGDFNMWLEWVKGKLNSLKDWATEALHGKEGSEDAH